MKAISVARGGTILCSHNHFTLCKRLCFLPLHLPYPRQPPSLLLTRPRPTSSFYTSSKLVSPPKPRLSVLRAAESTQPTSLSSSSADKTIITDDDFSLAKVFRTCHESPFYCFLTFHLNQFLVLN